jgi:hypothetical protein
VKTLKLQTGRSGFFGLLTGRRTHPSKINARNSHSQHQSPLFTTGSRFFTIRPINCDTPSTQPLSLSRSDHHHLNNCREQLPLYHITNWVFSIQFYHRPSQHPVHSSMSAREFQSSRPFLYSRHNHTPNEFEQPPPPRRSDRRTGEISMRAGRQ